MKNLMALIAVFMFTGCYTHTADDVDGEPIGCETDCDDGNDCTEDVCNSDGECQHFAIPFCHGCSSHSDCDDGDDCTLNVCTYNGHCVYDVVCVEGLDQDGDGYDYPADCDDIRIDVYPGAPELCDHRDNDCDFAIDEGDACDYVCDFHDLCREPNDFSDIEAEMTSMPLCDHSFAASPTTDCASYIMSFHVNLTSGDVIERLVIHQTEGVMPIPPSSHSSRDRTTAELRLTGFVGITRHETPIAWAEQNDNGSFRFENIVIDQDLNHAMLVLRIPISENYTGHVLFALMSPDDYVVTGKTTATQWCEYPQYGPVVTYLCRDLDGDGLDSAACGGTDAFDYP